MRMSVSTAVAAVDVSVVDAAVRIRKHIRHMSLE
jgi:hypothetical protein